MICTRGIAFTRVPGRPSPRLKAGSASRRSRVLPALTFASIPLKLTSLIRLGFRTASKAAVEACLSQYCDTPKIQVYVEVCFDQDESCQDVI